MLVAQMTITITVFMVLLALVNGSAGLSLLYYDRCDGLHALEPRCLGKRNGLGPATS